MNTARQLDPLQVAELERDRLGAVLYDLLRVVDCHTQTATQPGTDRDHLAAALAAIAAAATTVALSAKVNCHRVEYMALGCTAADVTIADHGGMSTLSEARAAGLQMVRGRRSVIHYRVQRRTHVTFDDGSTHSSTWQTVDDRGRVFPCGNCGTLIFKAYTPGMQALYLDADPDPAGELTINPSTIDGGEPYAIYGTPTNPNASRFQRHTAADRRSGQPPWCVPPTEHTP